MFYGCTNLTSAPQLPATTLPGASYRGMFMNCTSLTQAPALPATSMSGACYQNMFRGCSRLTTAPELSATTLAGGCYSRMFSECTSLSAAPELPATTLAESCYWGMFRGCTSLTTKPELPATTLEKNCYQGMFHGCRSLSAAPELPATTLAQGCYDSMFYNCTSIEEIKIAYTGNFSGDGVPSNAFNHWVYQVASTGTFYYDGTDTTRGMSAIPTNWNVEPLTPPIDYLDYINTNVADFDTGVKPTTSTVVQMGVRGDALGNWFVGTSDQNWRFFCAGDYAFYFDWNDRISTGENAWDVSQWYELTANNYSFTYVPEGGGTSITESGST